MHVYTHGRELERQKYPTRSRTTRIDQPIGISQLYELRCQDDRSAHQGYKYSIIGTDETAYAWNDFGIREGLMSHQWRDELEELMELSRGDGNKLLAAKLEEQTRHRYRERFA